MTDQKPFRVEVEVDAPADAVWRALTAPDQIREWFGYDYDGIEEEIRAIFVDDGKPTPPERIVFSDGSFIELTPEEGRTIVRAVMPGPLAGATWDDVYDPIEQGWRTFLEQLRFLLETRPGGRRRTVYLTGEATGAQVLDLAGAGKPWFEGRRERLVVGERDHHLVGAAADRPFASGETGPVNILVSTFGLDDAAFARVRDEWEARWRAAVRNATVTAGS